MIKIIHSIKNYFVGAVAEISKVSWPTKKQTINYSLVVIALSLATAILLGIFDFVFNLGLEKII